MNIRFVGVLAAMVLPIATAMMACSDSSTGGGDAPPPNEDLAAMIKVA